MSVAGWIVFIIAVAAVIGAAFYIGIVGQKILDRADDTNDKNDLLTGMANRLYEKIERIGDDIHAFAVAQNLPDVQPGDGRHAMGKRGTK